VLSECLKISFAYFNLGSKAAKFYMSWIILDPANVSVNDFYSNLEIGTNFTYDKSASIFYACSNPTI